MYLTKDEEKMLSGGYGEGYRRAMDILVTLGDFYDAKRLIPISMAFIVSGPNPRRPGKAFEWVKEVADAGTTFKCPLTLIPMGQPGNPSFEIHKKMGAIFAFGGGFGHPRNMFVQPVFGQDITSDGTAVTHYINSYIGARGNTECFGGQYSAAIVGKTPEYGYHLTENRVGKTLFNVKADLKDETDWGCLGFYISVTLGKNYWDVPVMNGVNPANVTHDELVGMCSTIPAYGAVVHSLLVGISPEARTLDKAFAGEKPIEKFVVGEKEIKSVYERFSTSKKKPDMVSFGGFGADVSIENVNKIASLVKGKKVCKDFPTIMNIDGPVRATADRTGVSDILREAGISIGMGDVLKARGIQGEAFTNNPVMSAKRMGWNTLVFIDAKSCHYIGNQDIEPVLKHVEEAVEIALTGKIR